MLSRMTTTPDRSDRQTAAGPGPNHQDRYDRGFALEQAVKLGTPGEPEADTQARADSLLLFLQGKTKADAALDQLTSIVEAHVQGQTDPHVLGHVRLCRMYLEHLEDSLRVLEIVQ